MFSRDKDLYILNGPRRARWGSRRVFVKLDFARSLFKIKVLGKRVPLSVNLIINSACNSSCSYCHTSLYGDGEMDTQAVVAMIDEFALLGMIFLSLTGGEPLLRDDIGEIIDHAHRRGVRTRLTTNGILLPKRIESLRNLDTLLVSLDGLRSFNDKVRGKGSYQHALQALRMSRAAGMETIISTVITKQTPEDIDSLVSIAREHGAGIIFQPAYLLFPEMSTQDVERLNAIGSAAQPTWKYIVRLKKSGGPVANSHTYLEHVIGLNRSGGCGCWAGKAFCCVYPDGRVNPCGSLSSDWPNGARLGFTEAFYRLPEVSCTVCSCVSFVELNTVFSRPALEVLFNALKWY